MSDLKIQMKLFAHSKTNQHAMAGDKNEENAKESKARRHIKVSVCVRVSQCFV